ncbi:retrovirus-related pol polyprotein from transposon TNT 1-94 [Tanacetum coccineum]
MQVDLDCVHAEEGLHLHGVCIVQDMHKADQSFVVLVFSPGDDLIAYLNKAMAFLTVVASSMFPSTNNQLRTSSNPRNQATIQDGRVIVQQVQGRQGKSLSGNWGIRVMLLVLGEIMQADMQGLLNVIIVKIEGFQIVGGEEGGWGGWGEGGEEGRGGGEGGGGKGEKRFTPQQELSAEQAFWLCMSNPTSKPSDASPVKIEAPKELPKVSLVSSLKMLKFHLFKFDTVVKKRITSDAITEGEWGFEHTKAVLLKEVILFFTILKGIFNIFDRYLLNELIEVQSVFNQMEAAVQQSSVDKQCCKILKKELFLENDRLLQKIMSQDVQLSVMNSSTLIDASVNGEMQRSESCDKCFNIDVVFKDQFDSIKKTHVCTKEQSDSLIDKLNLKSIENEDLKAQIRDMVFVITSLKNDLALVEISVLHIRLKCSTSNCGSKPTGNKKNDRILQTLSRNMKNKVEAQPRKVNKKNRVVKPIRDADVKHSLLNANSELVCATCNKCMFDVIHDMCLLDFVKKVNSRVKSAKKHKKQNIWKPTGHVFIEVGLKWKPTGRTFTIVGNTCPLTRITSANVVPPKKTTSHSVETPKPELKVYSRRPKQIKKLSRLFSVRFRNDQIARIMRYGDYQLGNVNISRVYYVEGLGHNLLYVRQFYDTDLEVAFRKNTCFIKNLEGVDLLSGSRDTNLYTISHNDMLKTSPICLLSKASKTKSWLWHRKSGRSNQPKAEDTNQEKLYLLHMDLCGPMRVASINGKRYILVIVDDYSRFTWVRFLRTKDEAPEAIIKCIKNIQVRLNATVCNVRTDNGTEFVNQTLCEFYKNVGISHQTSVAHTPQQNDVVERRN